MANSYQKEIPSARINITLDVETEGAERKQELPCKLLILGGFSHQRNEQPVAKRERININKQNFDEVLAKIKPRLLCSVMNTLSNNQNDMLLDLEFNSLADFHPDNILRNVASLNKLVAMRNLLRDLRANIIDNKTFCQELEKIVRDKKALQGLQHHLNNLSIKESNCDE